MTITVTPGHGASRTASNTRAWEPRALPGFCYPRQVRRVAIAVLTVGSLHAARAEDDPRDVFGFKPKPVDKVDCGEGTKTFGCVSSIDLLDPTSPYALRTWLPSTYLLRLPVGDARHDDVVGFAAGVARDDIGPSFAGATGLENTWTVEGAPTESLRTGNVETRIPLPFTTGVLVTAGGFAARDRAGLGGSVDVELVRGGRTHQVSAYAWSGLSAEARDRPIAAQTYQLRRIEFTAGPEASFVAVASGPLGRLRGGRAWYAAGAGGSLSLTDVDWRAARLVDSDADGIADGLPGTADAGGDGKVDLEGIELTGETIRSYSVPVMARAGWERGPHDVTLTLLGNFSRDAAFLANATQRASGVDRDTQILDGIAAWRGTWKTTRARVFAAWHRSDRSEAARDPLANNVRQLQTAYVPASLADDAILATACSDGAGDPYPGVPNCPVPFGFFSSAGAGQLIDSVGDRPTLTADVAHLVGNHVLRTGGTFEDTRLVTTSRFTGGAIDRSLLEGHLDRLQFLGSGACDEEATAPCDYASSSQLTYRTRYSAVFVEDTFVPWPGLRVDTGVRWELMWVGPRLHFSDELAPRLGVAWDLNDDGSTRWWASMGRTHALLPAGMGVNVIQRDATVRDISFQEANTRRVDRGAVFSIAEDVQPIAQDELTTGFELGVVKAVRLGAWLQHRTLRRGLDTVEVNGAGDVFVDNPGRAGTFTGTPALRDSTVIAADVLIAPSPKLSVRATYSWGRTVGSWTGPFDPRQGVTLYADTAWDLDATNLYGALPTDPGHRVAIEAERRGRLGSVDLAVATRLTVNSGRPRNVFADTELGVVHMLPRGSGGRMPTLSQANVRLAARWRQIDFTLDAFNVFDRQEAVTAAELYTDGTAPIVNGTLQDLVFAKTEVCNDQGTCAARPVSRRTTFGLPSSFQSPLSLVLGIHRAF